MCALCKGTRLYLPKGAQEPQDCLWCEAADKATRGPRHVSPALPAQANDNPDLDQPIPF